MDWNGEPLSVRDFLNHRKIPQCADVQELCDLFEEITGEEPVMWGPSIVGFGCKDLLPRATNATDGLELGFAPRDGKIVLYLRRYAQYYEDILGRMGNVFVGKTCVAFESLDQIDRGVLRELIKYAWCDRQRAC